MKCTKCNFENSENAKFCIKCGTPLEEKTPRIKLPLGKKAIYITLGIVIIALAVWGILLLTGGGKNMVFVKGGTFKMGSNEGDSDEKPIHTVTVNDFYIGKYEVTNTDFCKFLNVKGNQTEGGVTWLDINDVDCRIEKRGSTFYPKSGYEKHPVIEVSWYGAKEYCKWKGGRLPTEAEWEYAARGGNKNNGYKYSGSNNIGDVAWYTKNSYDKGKSSPDYGTHAVGTKQANEIGIYDMSGNVWEWCSDWYGSYSSGSQNNPQGATSGSHRVRRGGDWSYSASNCRVAGRDSWNPDGSYCVLGFRLASSN